jgi:DNA repair exonuclease SbcCD ATPase subunit
MEAETETLRGMLAQAARPSDAAGDSVLKGLEQENRRLRSAMGELARVSAVAAEADSLRERLTTTQGELAQTTRALQEMLDDQGRERKEHEALVNELRSQVARESLKRQETQVLNAVVPASKAGGSAMSPDDRIRAFRQHLKEIHEKEAEERAQRTISARVSRLWRKTGPRG